MYRMSNEHIGCSLADAAATPTYMKYLEAAVGSPPSLHVIYINTKLETKAYAHELVPTITCTSSNVVQTILQVGKIRTFFIFGLCSYRCIMDGHHPASRVIFFIKMLIPFYTGICSGTRFECILWP